MAFGYLVVALLAGAVVVFAFQNAVPVSVRFLAWTWSSASVAALSLAALVSGLVVAGVPMWIQRWRLRARVRRLEVQVSQLETSLADRDKALLALRSTPGPH